MRGKKGRPRSTLRVISRAPNNNGRQTFRANVDSCSPERALRACNICIIAVILTPFDAECIWSLPFEASLLPRAPPFSYAFSLSTRKTPFTSAIFTQATGLKIVILQGEFKRSRGRDL